MEKIQLLERKDITQCAQIVNLNYNNKFKSTIHNRLQEMFSVSYNRSKPTFMTIKFGTTVVAFGGYSESQFNTGTYELFLINVHPAFQHKGYGKKIVLALLTNLVGVLENDFWIILNCKRELVNFYHMFGFTACTSRKDGAQYLMTMNTTYLLGNLNIFQMNELRLEGATELNEASKKQLNSNFYK